MPDLTTRYLGLTLRSPIVASSSPLTSTLSGLRLLEKAGAGAAVLPSLFEEQITFEASELDRLLETGAGAHGEASSYFPELADYDTGPGRYLELIAEAKRSLELPIIASLNATSTGAWIEHARKIEAAGADAIELNLFHVAADPDATAAHVEGAQCDLVKELRRSLRIPIALKIGPYFTAFAHTARELVRAGADGLVLFNRFYQPDVDLESLAVAPRLAESTAGELRLPLRWIGILHGQVDASLAATSGVKGAEDVIKALLVGADVAMMAFALLDHGPDWITRTEHGLCAWMEAREYESVEQLKGSVSRSAVADPADFERANYMRALRSYSSRFHY